MSPSFPRKRKDAAQISVPQPPSKKLRESHISDPQFQVVKASLVLSVPPVFAANPRAGVEEMLDSMIMRYIPSLQGVVLSHSNLTFMDKVAVIQRDCPFLVCTAAFDATLWSPRVGLNLSGKVNLCSPDHISLLVHRTFNVSIPRHHILTDTWEFEYGPAENDPEYGHIVNQEQDFVHDEESREIDQNTRGRWVHKVTGEILGSKDGLLEFTVIGLTVANEMLSLLGSLQPDPFSPRHTILQHRRTTDTQEEEEEEHESSEVEDDVGDVESDSDGEDNESGLDTFQSLGKRKDLHDKSRTTASVTNKVEKRKRV